jgi:hypothetical protein
MVASYQFGFAGGSFPLVRMTILNFAGLLVARWVPGTPIKCHIPYGRRRRTATMNATITIAAVTPEMARPTFISTGS